MTKNSSNLTVISNNNTTTSSTPYIPWQHWNWIVPVTVNSIFILMTLWILISLIHYGNKSKKWVTTKEKNVEKLNAGFILMAAVFCGIMSFLRFIASQFVFNIGFFGTKNNQCKMVVDASIILFCLANFAVHNYLWVRQLVFYTNRMLNTDFSKALRFFSYLSIILIFLGGLGVILVNTISVKYIPTLKGCAYIPLDSTSTAILVIVCLVVLLSGETMLVGLLIYPLHKHSKQKGWLALCGITNCFLQKVDQQNARQNTQNQSMTYRSATKKKINVILRRTVCFSIIIVVSNLVLLFISTYGFTENDNRNISTMLADFITFGNLAFVVSSIESWQKIVCFTPPRYTFISRQSTVLSMRSVSGAKQTSLID